MKKLNLPPYPMDEFKHAFGREVERVRRESGYTPEELAQSLNLIPKVIYSLELGNYPNWSTIFLIARLLRKKVYVKFV